MVGVAGYEGVFMACLALFLLRIRSLISGGRGLLVPAVIFSLSSEVVLWIFSVIDLMAMLSSAMLLTSSGNISVFFTVFCPVNIFECSSRWLGS